MQSKTTEHTPGPWALGHENGHGFDVVHEIAPNCGHLLIVSECHTQKSYLGHEIDRDAAQANARLIAAAPELLEALETLAAYANGRFGRNPYGIPEYKTALQAIAKAKGLPADGDKWMDANNEAYTARVAAEQD